MKFFSAGSKHIRRAAVKRPPDRLSPHEISMNRVSPIVVRASSIVMESLARW